MKLTIDTEENDNRESKERYMQIASCSHKLGRIKQATRATQIYYRQNGVSPHKIVDPFLGEKDGIPVTRDMIENISENLSKI